MPRGRRPVAAARERSRCVTFATDCAPLRHASNAKFGERINDLRETCANRPSPTAHDENSITYCLIECPERVSNPHAFRGRRILSPLPERSKPSVYECFNCDVGGKTRLTYRPTLCRTRSRPPIPPLLPLPLLLARSSDRPMRQVRGCVRC